jgi:hypothetical protein
VGTPADQQAAGDATYLVEHYWPGITTDRFEQATDRLRSSAERLSDKGTRVRLLHSTLVPQDEAAVCVFQAESRAAVEQAYTTASVPWERVLDALEIDVRATGAVAADEGEAGR